MTNAAGSDRLVVVLLGPPGGGKGTQAELLRERMGFTHFSTGNAFRDLIRRRDPLGVRLEQIVSLGQLVTDEITLGVVREFVDGHVGDPLLFDGFPRTIPQAEGLDKALDDTGEYVDMAILVDLPDDEVVKRLTARRQCRNCNKIYNLSFSPPKTEGVCDECGGELYQRKDDSDATIRDRLRTYHEQTEPVLHYYSQQGKLQKVAGELGRDRVYDEIARMVTEFSK